MPPISENFHPTIDDVAAALGMHKATVSKGLSGKGTISPVTRERILKVALEMGYEPNLFAQRLANKGNNRRIYLSAAVMDVGLGTEKMLLLQKQLKKLDYEVPIYSVSNATLEDQAHEFRDLCREQPRAIVYASQGWQPEVIPVLKRYQESGGILVCYHSPIPLECDQVVFDLEHNAYQTARHLIEHGHRKLGINVHGPHQKFSVRTSQHGNPRLVGFLRALEEAGIEMKDEWFFRPGGYEKGGAEMAERFLAMKDRPTGLCIVNDYTALAFMSRVMSAGIKIPEDLSIVGHDNEDVANYCPVPLTSAIHPIEEMVQSVIDLLIARLDGSKEETRTVLIRGGLVERSSVGVHKPTAQTEF